MGAVFHANVISLAHREKAIELVRNGASYEEAGRAIGRTGTAVARYCKAIKTESKFPMRFEETKRNILEHIAKGSLPSVVARELGVNASLIYSTLKGLTIDDLSPEIKARIERAISDGNSFTAIAKDLGVARKLVLYVARNGKPLKNQYSDEMKLAVAKAIESDGNATRVAAKFGIKSNLAWAWHRRAVENGTAKEPTVYKAKSDDEEFTWVTREYPQLEPWRPYLSDWLKSSGGGRNQAVISLTAFVERYLAPHELPAEPADFLRRGSVLPDFYKSAYVEESGDRLNGGIAKNNQVHQFLEWLLRQPDFADEDDDGTLVTSPIYRNPVPWMSKSKNGESGQLKWSNKTVLAYSLILDLRGFIAQGPSFMDWKNVQGLTGKMQIDGSNAGNDWFEVSEDKIDPRDSDCVTRVRETTTGKKVLEMWSPVRSVVILLKTQLPARTGQIRMSDSGEADTFVYRNGEFVLNKRPLAKGTERKPWRQSMIRRAISELGKEVQPVLYFNSNKTQDIGKAAKDRGQDCPWPHQDSYQHDPYYWIEKLRNWQEKYNPIDRATSWKEIPASRSISPKTDAQKSEYPDTCFLFRTPETPGETHLPVQNSKIETLWHALMFAFEQHLANRKITNEDGSRICLFKPGSDRSDILLHGLRVSQITHLVIDGDMPPHLLMKIVGHARIVMTLYCNYSGRPE